jgi:hypothetical protein
MGHVKTYPPCTTHCCQDSTQASQHQPTTTPACPSTMMVGTIYVGSCIYTYALPHPHALPLWHITGVQLMLLISILSCQTCLQASTTTNMHHTAPFPIPSSWKIDKTQFCMAVTSKFVFK